MAINENIVKEIKKRMSRVPPDIVRIFEDYKWVKIIEEIGERRGLSDRETEDLCIITGLLLGGSLHPNELFATFKEQTGFDDQTTNEVVQDLVQKLLIPLENTIKQYLSSLGEPYPGNWFLPQKRTKFIFRDSENIGKEFTEEEKEDHVGLEFEGGGDDESDFFSLVQKKGGDTPSIIKNRKEIGAIEYKMVQKYGSDLKKAEKDLRKELAKIEKEKPKGVQNIEYLKEELQTLPFITKIPEIEKRIEEIKTKRVKNTRDHRIDHSGLQKEQKNLEATLEKLKEAKEAQEGSIKTQIKNLQKYNEIRFKKERDLKELLDYKAQINALKNE
jgi:virulence-associated protein VapD